MKLEFRYVLAWLRYVHRDAYKTFKKPFRFAFWAARCYNLLGNNTKWNTTSYSFDLFLCISAKWDTTSYWFDLFLDISTTLNTTSYSLTCFLFQWQKPVCEISTPFKSKLRIFFQKCTCSEDVQWKECCHSAPKKINTCEGNQRVCYFTSTWTTACLKTWRSHLLQVSRHVKRHTT